MILRFLPVIVFLFSFFTTLHAQVTGQWKTIGDVDGKEKSIVEIYEQNGKLFGRIIKLLPAAGYTVCENCPGDLKNKPLTGMVILRDLTITKTGGEGGTVMDPGNGKSYKCYIELVDANTLKLRGYIGVPAIGRTQLWYRVKN
jgi:uncharacterized protein (DUF2147 family)